MKNRNHRKCKSLQYIFLLTFLLITSFINFFHTETHPPVDQLSPHTHPAQEKTTSQNRDCPACHFTNTTLNTGQIHFFFLPAPIITGISIVNYNINYKYIFSVSPASRSPPIA